MKRGTVLIRFLCAFGLAAAAITALAQSPTGSITGNVVDGTGAGLPGATVSVNNVDTGAAKSAPSGTTGNFTFPLLPVGRYTVSSELSGFATARVSNVTVSIGGQEKVTLKMEIAGVQAAVTVSSEAPLIEATQSQQESVVGQKLIENLPANGRNFIDFVLTTPGVVRDVRQGDISFAGQRGTLNSLIVDGADNNNTFFGQALGRTGSGRAPYQFSQDAVKEFQVNRNAYSAEYGRAGGAVINVVTKSGTNDFHGTGFYFYRDKKINAINYIDEFNGRVKAPYHFDQFGASVGGPVLRDKLFFFANYDGQRNTLPNTVNPLPPISTLPNDADTLAGYNRLLPLAQSWERIQDQDVYLVKADYEANGTNHVTLRYNRQDFTGGNFENGGLTNSIEHTGNSLVKTDTISGSLATSLSAGFFNELRGQYAKDSEPGLANSANPEGVVQSGGQTVLIIGRNSFSPRETTIKRYQAADTVTLLSGSNTLKVGFDYNKDDILNFFPGNFFGSYTFNSFANFNRGTPTRYIQAFAGPGTSGAFTNPNLREYAAFVSDEWRLLTNLTLNLGVRYDLQDVHQPSVQNPDAQLLAAGLRTDRIPTDKNNIAPRIGLAWTPRGDDRTVVRAGYGIFYARTPSIIYGTATSNNGINVQTITFSAAQAPTYPNIFAALPTGITLPKPTIFVMDPNYQNPKITQASAGVEHALTPDISLALGYLYVRGSYLTRSTDLNESGPEIVTTPIAGDGSATYVRYNGPRPFTNFARIIEFQSSASSRYNGATLELVKRYSRSWTARVAYTYSKVLDNKPDATAVVPGVDDNKFAQDPLNLNGDWAPGDNDVRHRLVVSGLWALDSGRDNPNAFMRFLTSGWSFAGIVTYQTGQPYSATINTDLNNDQNFANDRAPGFERNTFRLPSVFSVDPRISKHVGIGPVDVELIAEAFNVFNNKNVTFTRNTYYNLTGGQLVPVNNPASRTRFGAPTATLGPRILQIAAKVSF
ncbi:MAG: TonB-dependent receptor [Acidobacteria bacterium]|nr:TonB-dependent receptor [Acidobacteriota bacterium]MCA1611958.1 TonB-dependent receptor [Acidobacteriota bacterium]MCA1617294.1 TonB-dependent receptor [Acidobacteriota bacterium]